MNYKPRLIKALYLGGLSLIGTGLLGCQKKSEPLALPPPPPELHILNWADYITGSTLEEFGRQSGCEVFMHPYNSTDEMLSLLKSNAEGYDLVVVEDRMIPALAELKLIQKLNSPELKGFQNLDPELINLPTDPGNQYSIPYHWGTTLLAYRSDHINPPQSWTALFEPQYADKVLMFNIAQESFDLALRINGSSLNSDEPNDLKTATELLKKQATQIQGYADIYSMKEALLDGRCSLAPLYSGDAAEIAAANTNISYFIPIEGAPMWIDAFAISRDAPNVKAAKAFIEFMLDPEIAAANASALWYASANLKAKKFMNQQILEDPSLYPSEEIQAKLHFLKPVSVSKSSNINKNWNAIQTLHKTNKGEE